MFFLGSGPHVESQCALDHDTGILPLAIFDVPLAMYNML